jgi:SAM-dependent methyltransferase
MSKTSGAAAHLGIDLADYDARIRTFIPGYDSMLGIAAFALQLTARRAPTILDLGIGTGALAARCLDRVPAARIVGIDEDEAMLTAARKRLGRALKETIHGSFETVDLPPCDAVVASLSLHHIPTRERRLRLFRRIHRALRRGGVLISADCHPEEHPRLAAFDRAAWRHHLEESYTPAIARRYLRTWAGEDHYAPLLEELDTLRRARFVPDVAGRQRTWAVVVAARRG